MNPSKSSNSSMTELQLRLWCLWMCESFAGLSAEECLAEALRGAGKHATEALLLSVAAWYPTRRMRESAVGRMQCQNH